MPNRASQFIPFDSLKGFNKLLKEVEKMTVNKKTLSTDLEEIINKKLQKLKINDKIRIKFYFLTDYIETTGIVKKIDKTNSFIIVDHTKISFETIIDIEFT